MTGSKTVVGIDLGTTFSLVAALVDGRPILLPNALGETLTPSAVSVTEDGTALVGAPARAGATTHPQRTALAFKRDMGTERIYTLGDRSFSPQALSALVLASLKRDAEAALGVPIENVVITVPAYFGDTQRQATRDAGAIAGLSVERIVNEPTAAALAYGLHERHREMRAVVLDLGGGTFDVTVLEIIEGVIEIQASAGEVWLGGNDFDEALAQTLVQRVPQLQGLDRTRDALAWARLRDACELLKKRLSTAESSTITLPELSIAGKVVTIERTVSREEAEEAWQPLLDRMEGPIRRALADASLPAGDIDEVLLVGGATRMPSVARLASRLFSRLPLRALPPDEAVAMGAAVQAALVARDRAVDDLVVTDIAPFTLGTETAAKLGEQVITGLFTPILERGTVIPASRVKRFLTLGDMQSTVVIGIYQGEHSTCDRNTKLGEYRIEGIPARPAGEEGVDVRFTYDLNGILEVDTTIVSTGERGSVVIERTPGRLTPEQVASARRAMARLKLHPRDALPNATALARADALFVELTGDARAALGHAIAALRAAIEAQSEPEIVQRRERLLARIAELRRRDD
jgi:molecular chaperone HscC